MGLQSWTRLSTHHMIQQPHSWAEIQTSLVAQTVKHLPTMWETWVQALGQEGLLEKGKATHSSILASPPKKKGAQRNISRENHNSKRYMHPNVHCSAIHIYISESLCCTPEANTF